MKTTMMNIPVDQLTMSPDLKDPDNELIQFISKTYGWSFFNENAQFPVRNGIAFLDSLCSVRFDKLCRADKRKIQELMELVLKKTNDLSLKPSRVTNVTSGKGEVPVAVLPQSFMTIFSSRYHH